MHPYAGDEEPGKQENKLNFDIIIPEL